LAYSLVAEPAVRLQPVFPVLESAAGAVEEPDGALALAPFQVQDLSQHGEPILWFNTACPAEFDNKPATDSWQGMGHAVG
jgi:hypothetical protein